MYRNNIYRVFVIIWSIHRKSHIITWNHIEVHGNYFIELDIYYFLFQVITRQFSNISLKCYWKLFRLNDMLNLQMRHSFTSIYKVLYCISWIRSLKFIVNFVTSCTWKCVVALRMSLRTTFETPGAKITLWLFFLVKTSNYFQDKILISLVQITFTQTIYEYVRDKLRIINDVPNF